MAAIDDQARSDLNEKLKLERSLLVELRAFNKKLVRETVKAQGSGDVSNAVTLEPELTTILRDHYENVSPVFDSQISNILPEDIAETPSERIEIAAALLLFFNSRAPEQSAIITDTNEKDIVSSLNQSIDISQQEAADGRPQSRQEIAVVSGAILSRKLAGRVGSISAVETQVPAEAAKATEAQVLSGQTPSVIASPAREANVTKEWFTQGDERVRESHMFADSQEKDLNIAFVVGGQLLQYPGDVSLGATAGNVINCRCSSVVSRDDVFAVRRQRGEQPVPESVPSEQLLTSIGEIF